MLEKIREKAEKGGLKTSLKPRNNEDLDGVVEQISELLIEFPCDRDNKTVSIDERNEDLGIIEQSNFEKFKFINGLEAIYSSELGVVECEIQSNQVLRPTLPLLKRLSRIFNSYRIKEIEKEELPVLDRDEFEYNSKEYAISIPSPKKGVSIQLTNSSTEFSFLCGTRSEYIWLRKRLRDYTVIRIEGLTFETHNEIKETLKNIANSVFFQIDLLTNIPIHLAADKELRTQIRLSNGTKRAEYKLNAPKFQYDDESITLYWYARTAIDTPLLQYLAFYQVLEYYFPQFTAKEARDRIKNLIKDPTFESESEKNVTKILEIVKFTAKGHAIVDERNQIKATIFACIDVDALNCYFNEETERKDFFDDSKKGKSLVSQKISFKRKDHDIRIDVANRIYELRCRIVHTKDDSNSGILLPYSPELTLIKKDIDLVEYIARNVLIAASKKLEIK